MSNARFSPREMKFLEIYFAGALMKDAARAAGYQEATPQALYNSGKRVLTKFSNSPTTLFRLFGRRERKIAQLLINILESKSEHKQLMALKILSKCSF